MRSGPARPKTRSAVAAPRRRRWLLWTLCMTALLLVSVATLLAVLGLPPASLWQLMNERAPMAWVRYTERRLEGHPKLETVALPLLAWARQHLEREPPAPLADLGKGQRAGSLLPVRYGVDGRPLPTQVSNTPLRAPVPDKLISSVEQLAQALAQARPGQVLELASGTYTIRHTLTLSRAGTAQEPITLRARAPGSVNLVVETVQALVVGQPFWIFENLDWRGNCANDNQCEHAFHVVGPARGTVIVNNRMVDFNAHIKVNGENGQWPDHGLLQFSTLLNTRPRNTGNAVAPFDLVAASGWQVLDNHVENFVRANSDGTNYGLFMKGGGSGGRFERNLVVCTPRGISQRGSRVGLSVGNGGTYAAVCRDQRCDVEHSGAVVANNVVAHCNDAGIDVAKSRDTWILHNTLINTQGILVRNPPADAVAERNLFDGGQRVRQGSELVARDNAQHGTLADPLWAPDALDLRWREPPTTLPRHDKVPLDFCGKPRSLATPLGATVAPRC
jgi:Chondroitinase B